MWVMIIHPYRGLPEWELLAKLEKEQDFLKKAGHTPVIFWIGDSDPQLFQLAVLLKKVVGIGVVYFAGGWKKSKMCRFIYAACKEFGANIMNKDEQIRQVEIYNVDPLAPAVEGKNLFLIASEKPRG